MSDVGPPGRRQKRASSVVVGVVLVGAFAFLLVKGLGSSLDYFETVDQALPSKAMLGTKTFRLEGSGGSRIGAPPRRRGRLRGLRFRTDAIDVVNTGNPPQLFQPDIPVVVVGHFSGATFVSNQIIVDHTAQYVAKYPNRVRAPNGYDAVNAALGHARGPPRPGRRRSSGPSSSPPAWSAAVRRR